MATSAEYEEWKLPQFRRKVTTQIEDAVRKSGNPQMMTKNAEEIERDVFSKATSRDEYMNLVAKVLVYARDVGHGHLQGRVQQVGSLRMPVMPGQQGPMPPQVNEITTSGRPQYSTAPQLMGVVPNTTVSAAQYQVKHQMAYRNVQQGSMAQQPQTIQISQLQNVPHGLTPQQQQQFVLSQIQGAASQQQQSHQQQPHQQQQHQILIAQQQVAGLSGQQTHPQIQTAVSGSQPHPSPQMPSPAQLGTQSLTSVSQQLHVTPQGRQVQYVQSPAMPGTIRAPTPAPQPSPASQPTIAPSPACVSSPAPMLAPTPSPQQFVPQSPATSSVPTPSTLNVQSPASILNPGSVGPSVTSPAPLSAAEEQAYLEKHRQLSVFIDPLNRMIAKMNSKDHSTNDLKKLKNLLDILTNPSRRVPLTVLQRCEQVLIRMNLKPSTPRSAVTTSPTTLAVTTTPGPTRPTYPLGEDPSQQLNGQGLLETVTKNLKSPMFPHTLKRTFTPILQAMEGPPICPPPPPYKRIRLIEENKKKSPLPHALQGELARLCSRFTVKPDMAGATRQSSTLLRCSINDKYLPSVPPIEITVPQNYPMASPACKTNAYECTPFLAKIRSKLSSELRRMPGFYTVTALLGAWESSIRQACKSEVAVK